MTAAYSKIANAYDAFLTVSGFKRGVENFLERLELDFPPGSRLLDAGCGTGLMARYLAERFPSAEIIAFDINAKMLAAMARILERRAASRRAIIIAQGDLKNPARVQLWEKSETVTIPENYFDAVFVSGALEHVPLGETVGRLARHLKPGGIFFNLGVRRNPAGAVLGMVYRFRPYATSDMRRACEEAGLADIRLLRLKAEDFPANLSRIAVMARKKI